MPTNHEEWKMTLTPDGISINVMVVLTVNMLQFKHLKIVQTNFEIRKAPIAPIVFFAIVDHDYCFRYINVGSNIINSDGGVYSVTLIHEKLENDLLPNGEFLVGDDAFPLKTYLLKPHSHKPLT